MSKHKITACRSGHANGMDYDEEYEITFSFVAGAAPILYPPDNADPGWPDEVEVVSVSPVAADPLTHREVESWAQNWLQTDGYDEAVKIATEDSEPDPDRARDQRIDDEMMEGRS